MELEILDNPVTDNEPVTGVCEGRIVAYWPSKQQIDSGLCAVGSGGYIPAMIVASWAGRGALATSPMPAANLRLYTDGCNISDEILAATTTRGCLGSRMFSLQPARGCWTWIPKA